MPGMTTLFIWAGLPGTGKTTLAKQLASRLNALYLRIDTIEQTIRDACQMQVGDEGYRLAYQIAADNLRLGISVVADSCNPIEMTRASWEQVARDSGAAFINMEVVCTDSREHRQRIESRKPDIAGLRLPTWHDVQQREYHPWTRDRIVVDTAGRTEADCMDELLRAIGSRDE